MYSHANALEALARRRSRNAWLRVWWEGVRRDLFQAKKDSANAGWWSDLQDQWAAQQWREEGTSYRTRGW